MQLFGLYGMRFLILICFYVRKASNEPLKNDSQIINDQRQTGKYNIHINIKDVAIIELEKNEFADDTITNADEYYYDDDDLTIKPISNWIDASTTTTSVKPPSLTNTSLKNPTDLQPVTLIESRTIISASNMSTLYQNMSSFMMSPENSYMPSTDLRVERKPVMNDDKILLQHTARKTQHISPLAHDDRNTFQMDKVQHLKNRRKALHSHLTRLVICRKNYAINNNGNCRTNKGPSFLRNVFNLLKLIRVKET